ncbi:MAG: lamin tail domain-containing protein, partial [Chloroflexia bacterium]
TTAGSDAVPTEDPSLPPPIVDPYTTAILPTFTPAASQDTGNPNATSLGVVNIADIFFNGVKGSKEPDEYVEIANNGTQAVDMDGWMLYDIYGGQTFTWHGYTLPGHTKLRVYTNEVHSASGGFSFGSNSAIWANKGDAVELLDSTDTIISTFSYGAAN